MKLKKAEIGSTVKMNKSKAVVLIHGELGTRVNVIEGDPEQVTLGNQIWSNESEVSFKGQGIGKTPLSTQNDNNVPLK